MESTSNTPTFANISSASRLAESNLAASLILNTETNSEDQPPSNAEEEQKKRKRGRNWTWQENYAFLKTVHKEGKNWGKILSLLHDLNLCTDIKNHNKLREHYNTLHDGKSLLNKPYLTPKFSPKKGDSPETTQRKEQEHSHSHQLIHEEREQLAEWMRRIEDRELGKSAGSRVSEEDLRKDMHEKKMERKRIKMQERKIRDKMINSLDIACSSIPKMLDMQEKLLDLYRERFEWEKQKNLDKNDNQ